MAIFEAVMLQITGAHTLSDSNNALDLNSIGFPTSSIACDNTAAIHAAEASHAKTNGKTGLKCTKTRMLLIVIFTPLNAF